MLDWFKDKLQRIYFREYWREVSKVVEEPYTDLAGTRLIDFVHLVCGHQYWQEKDNPRKFAPRICDSCLVEGLQKRYGRVRGWNMYNTWLKWGRVKG